MTDNYLFKTVACLLTAVMITGCAMPNAGNADEEVLTATEETESADTSDVSEGSETVEEYDPSSGNLTLSDQGKSLAQRMCGKYSYHYGSGDMGDDEFLIMNVFTFGDNLYAFCGYAMADETELESYSFWASEFIPYDASEMESTDGDSVRVKECRRQENTGTEDRMAPSRLRMTGLFLKILIMKNFYALKNTEEDFFLKTNV